MKDILVSMGQQIVERNNTLRFKCSDLFDLVLRSEQSEMQKTLFLKSIFGWDLIMIRECIERCNNGESFIDITNHFNTRKLL